MWRLSGGRGRVPPLSEYRINLTPLVDRFGPEVLLFIKVHAKGNLHQTTSWRSLTVGPHSLESMLLFWPRLSLRTRYDASFE